MPVVLLNIKIDELSSPSGCHWTIRLNAPQGVFATVLGWWVVMSITDPAGIEAKEPAPMVVTVDGITMPLIGEVSKGLLMLIRFGGKITVANELHLTKEPLCKFVKLVKPEKSILVIPELANALVWIVVTVLGKRGFSKRWFHKRNGC